MLRAVHSSRHYVLYDSVRGGKLSIDCVSADCDTRYVFPLAGR